MKHETTSVGPARLLTLGGLCLEALALIAWGGKFSLPVNPLAVHVLAAVLLSAGLTCFSTPWQWMRFLFFVGLSGLLPGAGSLTVILFHFLVRPSQPHQEASEDDTDASGVMMESLTPDQVVLEPLGQLAGSADTQALSGAVYGLESVSSERSTPLLRHFSNHENPEIQLVAQGILSDRAESQETLQIHWKDVLESDPDNTEAIAALAEIHLHLATNAHRNGCDARNQALTALNVLNSTDKSSSRCEFLKGRSQLVLGEIATSRETLAGVTDVWLREELEKEILHHEHDWLELTRKYEASPAFTIAGRARQRFLAGGHHA